MMTVLKKPLLPLSILVICYTPSGFATNGMVSHGFGTTQKAMGGAAVAGHDNAMNMATNPASMSFGKNNWTGGVDIFKPERGASTSAGSSYDGNSDSVFVIPEFAYQKKISDKDTIGIAVYGNGGMNTSYDQAIFNFNGIDSGIDLSQLFIAPSWSRMISDNTSFGVSLNLAYQRIEVTGIDAFGVFGFSSDASNLSDNGYDSSTGAGVTIGVQHKVSDDVKLGASYRSRTYMSEFEKYAGLLAEKGDLDVPSMINVGAQINVSPKTTLAMDFSRINYSEVKSMNNSNAATSGLLGTDNGAGFGWESQNVFKVGVKHQLKPDLAIMAGYNHGDSPISEDQTAFNILAPGVVEDHLTLGMDWKLSSNSSLTAQYMHAFNNEVKGDGSYGSICGTCGPATANLEMKQNAIGVAYNKTF